jgi:hypothetical protein
MGSGFSLEEYNDLKYNVKQKQLMSYLNFHKNILKYIGIILIIIINYCIYYYVLRMNINTKDNH